MSQNNATMPRLTTWSLLTIGVIFCLAPVAWGISTSLKTPLEVSSAVPRWVPENITFQNYQTGLFNNRMGTYFLNTIEVIFFSMIISILLASHAAYGLARRKFYGRNVLAILVWTTIMVPGIAVIVPLYMISVDIGLFDTKWALVIVFSAWLVPTLIWLLRGFIEGVPIELEESALLDGCSNLGVFYRIVVPLLVPGFAASAVLVFVLIWNEFLIGYALSLSDSSRLVQVGVYFFISETGIQWGPLMAAALGSALPVIILYGLLQKAFVQGLTGGAVKG